MLHTDDLIRAIVGWLHLSGIVLMTVHFGMTMPAPTPAAASGRNAAVPA